MRRVTVSLSGDIMIDRLFNDMVPRLKSRGWSETRIRNHVWSRDFVKLLGGTAWFGNLETSIITDDDPSSPQAQRQRQPWPHKTFHFGTQESVAQSLLIPISRTTDVTAFNVANNHILDMGEEGLRETLSILDQMGIAHAGAGLTLNQAQRACIVETHGVRLALLGAGDHPTEWAASDEKSHEMHVPNTWKPPGINYVNVVGGPRAWAEFLQTVRDTANSVPKHATERDTAHGVDALIVYLHIGANYQASIPQTTVAFARAIVDAGATIVAVTSPHHLHRMERYGQGVIFYSLGDALDDYAIDPTFRNDLGVLAQVDLLVASQSHSHIKQGSNPREHVQVENVRLFPTKISDLTVRLLNPHRDLIEFKWVMDVLLNGFTPFR